jgi:hypothetical protein
MHNTHEYVSHSLHMISATSLRCVLYLMNVKDSLFFNWNRLRKRFESGLSPCVFSKCILILFLLLSPPQKYVSDLMPNSVSYDFLI